MNEFIRDHCVRADSMRLSEFIRALRTTGYKMTRTAIVAELAREFKLTEAGKQTWIVGLSLRSNKADKLRQFLNDNCIRADGLEAKLLAITRGAAEIGISRNEVIQQLRDWGFEITTAGGAYVVRGLGMKEASYA